MRGALLPPLFMGILKSRMSHQSCYILGSFYSDDNSSQKKMRKRSESLFRFTYRRDFVDISNSGGLTSDAGWGCMLRSAQMLLGNALLRCIFSSQWQIPDDTSDLQSNSDYKKILRWFFDAPGPQHPYSLHNLVTCGTKYNKQPGEWFGPALASFVMRDLARLHRRKYGGPMEIYVTQGDTMYYNDVQSIFAATSTDSASTIEAPLSSNGGGFFDPLINLPPSMVDGRKPTWPSDSSLLIIVPLMLGISSVSSHYYEGIKEVLRNDKCVGIIGGRCYHAMYFVGYNEDGLLGLDPHTTFSSTAFEPQSSSTAADANTSVSETFPQEILRSQLHVEQLEPLDFARLDPSLAVGFFFASNDEFEEFYENIRAANVQKKAAGRDNWCLFHAERSAPSYMRDEDPASDCLLAENDPALHRIVTCSDDEDEVDFAGLISGSRAIKAQSSVKHPMIDIDLNEPDDYGDDIGGDYVLV